MDGIHAFYEFEVKCDFGHDEYNGINNVRYLPLASEDESIALLMSAVL